jgi:hypothetical protein
MRRATSLSPANFSAKLLSGHKEDAAEVPFDPRERWSVAAQPLWPGRRGFPVKATLNGIAFESAIVSRSRRFWLLVPETVEQAAKVTAGDPASFTIAPA